MLDVRLSYHKQVRVVKTQERAVTWTDLVTTISTYHGTCKNTFDVCKMKID
jgi:hypothetical protein